MKKQKKIGIVGGSYNPIHIGHLMIAEYFKEQLSLDLILLIPSNVSPFKLGDANQYADSVHRLNMVKLACRNNKAFVVDDVELIRSGVSYTIDTVKYLHSKYLNAELYLLVGEDQAIQFDKWNKWREIITYTKICVAMRDITGQSKNTISSIFTDTESKPIWIESPLIEISSSAIRDRIKTGKSIRYQVPNSVLNYIERNSLYKLH